MLKIKNFLILVLFLFPAICLSNIRDEEAMLKAFAEDLYCLDECLKNPKPKNSGDEIDLLERFNKYKILFEQLVLQGQKTEDVELFKTNYIPLVKVAIRRLEDHLGIVYGYRKRSHFSRVKKPVLKTLFLSSCLLFANYCSKKIGILTDEREEYLSSLTKQLGCTVVLSWLLFEYKHEIIKKVKDIFRAS